jgi:hypothetical protein
MIAAFIGVLVVYFITTIVSHKKTNRLKKQMETELLTASNGGEIKKNFSKKIQRINVIATVIMVLPIAAIAVYFFTKESTERAVLLVVNKADQKYLYHSSFAHLEVDIERGNYPNIDFYSKVKIYPIGKHLFIEPKDLAAFADLLFGELTYVSYPSAGQEGFVTVKGFKDYYSQENRFVPSNKLGEVEKEFTITLRHHRDSIQVIWREDTGKNQLRPIRNCSLKEVYVVSGKYGTSEDRILFNLNELVAHLNPAVDLRLDKSNSILNWQLNQH